MKWNVVVTVLRGPQFERELLGALARFGHFRPTHFRDVCIGEVADLASFLDAIQTARQANLTWAGRVGRVIPIETVFFFTPDALAEKLSEAVVPLVARMSEGSFCVRLERRGLIGQVKTQEIERTVGERVVVLAKAQGKRMQVELDDPDWTIAAQTVGQECGVALLPRELRTRFPFVQTR